MGLLNISTEQQIKKQVADSGILVAENQLQLQSMLPQAKKANIFDAKAVIGGRLALDGKSVEDLGDYYTTDFIPVDIHNGSILYCSTTPNRAFRYDAGKNPIDSASLSNAQIPLTLDTKFIRISGAIAGVSSMRIAYTPVVNYPYYNYEKVQPLKVEEDGIIDRLVWDKNLFEKEKATFGYYITTNDTMAELSGYVTSDYIPVSRKIWPRLHYKLHYQNSDITSLLGVVFYDSNLRMISYNKSSIEGDTIEIIEDAAYVRIMTGNYTSNPIYLFVVKYECFTINKDWDDILKYKRPVGQNMFDCTQYIEGIRIAGTGNSLIYGADYRTSPFIPVEPGSRYFVSHSNSAINDYYIYTYDENKISIGRLMRDYLAPYWEVPSDCHYVRFNLFEDDNSKYTCKKFLVDTKDNFENLGELIAEDEHIKAYITINDRPPFATARTIKGVFENHVVLSTDFVSNIVYYSSNGFDGPYTTVDFSNLPNLNGEIISRVVFFYTKNNGTSFQDLRALLFGRNKGLWCSCLAPVYNSNNSYSRGDKCSYSSNNYECISEETVTGTWDATKWKAISNEFGYFEECNIWDMKGNHHWRIADNDKDPSGVRYRKYYDNRAAAIGRFTYYTGPIWINGQGQYARGLMFGNYSDNRRGNLSEPACMYFTIDGKNVYVQYEFGVYPRQYKLGGSSSITDNTFVFAPQVGDTVDFTGFSGTNDYAVRKRIPIVPSAEDKDPIVLFEYDNEINVTGINGSSITVADASSLTVGDHIVFTGSATGDYTKLLTSSIDSTTGVGDGNVFIITAKNGNVITVADSIGNPKNNLFCRHIHGISNFGNGVCMFTGEQYPDGWFIYLNPDMSTTNDNDVINNSIWQDSVVRLNSSKDGHQRSLGVYLRNDGKMITISDNSGPYAPRLQVRNKDIMMVNFGVYVFSLADIDNVAGQLSKIPNLNACYSLYNIGGLLFLSDAFGKTYYSTDEGDTWKHICDAGADKNKLVGFDKNGKRFFFNYANGGQFVFEVK